MYAKLLHSQIIQKFPIRVFSFTNVKSIGSINTKVNYSFFKTPILRETKTQNFIIPKSVGLQSFSNFSSKQKFRVNIGKIGLRAIILGVPALALGFLSKSQAEEKKADLPPINDPPTKEKEEKEGNLWLQLLSPQLPILLPAIVASLISSIIGIYIPKMIGKLLDIIKGSNQDSLNNHVWTCIGLLGTQVALTFLFNSLLSVAVERFIFNLRKKLFGAILRNDISFFDVSSSGELMSKVSSDVQEVRFALRHMISTSIRSITQIIGGFVSLWLISRQLTIAMLVIIPGVVGVGTVWARSLQRMSKKVQESVAKTAAIAEESISNVRTVRSFANEEFEEERYAQKLKTTYKLSKARDSNIALFSALYSATLQAYVLLVLLYGGKLVSSGQMTEGSLTSYMLYTMNLQFAMSSLSVLQGELVKGIASASRIAATISHKPQIPIKGGKTLSSVRGNIEFKNVSFAYPSRPDVEVLKQLNVKMDESKVYALVGHSGSGKSTTAWLVERFYDPSEGTVLLDGIDIKTLDPSWLRRQIALVSQEPALFSGTIEENIMLGKPGATKDEIERAAKLANADSFIRQFPSSYQTIVGERGVQLSGGQKQRIAIARAILKDAKVLILDEATSALDSESEGLVQEALQRLMKGRTTLLIAHRLSTVRNADEIIVLKHGKLVELGSHDELLKKKDGVYASLVSKQVKNL